MLFSYFTHTHTHTWMLLNNQRLLIDNYAFKEQETRERVDKSCQKTVSLFLVFSSNWDTHDTYFSHPYIQSRHNDIARKAWMRVQ